MGSLNLQYSSDEEDEKEDPLPETSNSRPQAPSPKPSTPNPKPQTSNPKPQSPIPEPRTPTSTAPGRAERDRTGFESERETAGYKPRERDDRLRAEGETTCYEPERERTGYEPSYLSRARRRTRASANFTHQSEYPTPQTPISGHKPHTLQGLWFVLEGWGRPKPAEKD